MTFLGQVFFESNQCDANVSQTAVSQLAMDNDRYAGYGVGLGMGMGMGMGMEMEMEMGMEIRMGLGTMADELTELRLLSLSLSLLDCRYC